jgi:hypothetical protein
VDAYRTWSHVGADAFLSRCTPSHPLVQQIREGKAIL